ncbi:DNRLRE domain-containing protein [Paenibacillus sp. HB172176]|uniref:DNRLRE domain-containing protein n=1 Tax=Paenibacillus sp. HB172176 TaxID=2493690 RepID=UPI00143A5841|nr:DNRLRE domain-containing protein [Paenibacillus sp. HB172176]
MKKKILSITLMLCILLPLLISGLQANAAEQENNKKLQAENEVDDQLADLEDDSHEKLKKEKHVVKELKEKRTSNSKHYLMSDGSIQATIFMDNVNYEDENGDYQEINVQLIDEADLDFMNVPLSKVSSSEIKNVMKANKNKRSIGKMDKSSTYFRALQVPFDVKIPKQFDKGYTIGDGKEQLTFVPVDANTVAGSVYSKSTINYEDAWLDTDVSLELTDKGIKESIYLKSPESPSTFSFEIDGQINEDLTSGNLLITPAWLMDANGVKRDVNQTLSKVDGKQVIQITVDTEGLSFPIMIDPTIVTKSTAQDTYVGYYSPPGYEGDSYYLSVGSGNGSPSQTYSSYIQFDISSIPYNSIVNSAIMGLYIYTGYTNESIDGYIYLVTSPWDEDTLGSSSLPSINSESVIMSKTGKFGEIPNSIIKPGWWNTDIASYVQQWVDGTNNYGVYITLYNAYQSSKRIYSSEYENAAYRPKLTVTYESPPVNAQILSPNGGETIDKLYNISWNASTDADTVQSLLKYQIQLSQNGGSSWVDLLELSSAAQTNLNYDFSQLANSTNNKVRVRAYDGFIYGPWDQSDAPFTIKHNQSPTAPTNLAPGSTSSASPSLTATTTPTLSWSFSDPDTGDEQSQYKVTIYQGSTLIKDSGWIGSSATYYTVPTNILSRNSTYNWQIQTKDASGAASPSSTKRYFKINSLPTATITAYTDGEEIPDNVLTFTWTYADSNNQAQSHYQIQGTQDNWATIAYNSGVISGDATTFTTPPLGSGNWQFKLLVKDGMEWSNAAFRTNLTLPNAYEPNDTGLTAYPIQYNQNYSSLIHTSTDIDFFTYTAAETGIDRITLSVPTSQNYDIYVYDSNMNLISSESKGTGQTENVLFDTTNGTTYLIKIIGVSGSYSDTESYNLTVSPVSMQFHTTYDYDDNGNMTNKTESQVQ